jgi:hypothetical protein
MGNRWVLGVGGQYKGTWKGWALRGRWCSLRNSGGWEEVGGSVCETRWPWKPKRPCIGVVCETARRWVSYGAFHPPTSLDEGRGERGGSMQVPCVKRVMRRVVMGSFARNG